MGAVAAAVSKEGDNVVPRVAAMLRELAHRGADAQGLATPSSVTLARSPGEFEFEEVSSPIAVGHSLSRVLPGDRPQPVLGEGFALAVEGRFFPPRGPAVDRALRWLKHHPNGSEGRLIEEFEGSYVFAVARPGELVCGRDTLGTAPLYYGEGEALCAISSERKALWTLGIRDVRSFPPGNVAAVSGRGFSFSPVRVVVQPSSELLEMGVAAERLRGLLLRSTGERVEGLERVAVAFSGGLDSGVVAASAKLCGAEVHLVSVGLAGRPELRHAEAAAEALELPLHPQTHTVDDVERALPRVLWLVEEADITKAGVAVPLYWAAEAASRVGCRVLLSGQLGDELFGGYHRYLRVYAQGGEAAVGEALFRDVASSYERNFQRDEPVCAFHGVELRLPFADREVVDFSLALPVALKIQSERDSLRKRVLRQTAQALGLPRFIAQRPKKAVQYATGVDRAIRGLARDRGLTPQEYLMEIFGRVYGGVEGP